MLPLRGYGFFIGEKRREVNNDDHESCFGITNSAVRVENKLLLIRPIGLFKQVNRLNSAFFGNNFFYR